LRHGSDNLDYLLDDEDDEPKRGWGKLAVAVIALALIGGFGYLRWKQGGFNFVKPAPVARPSQSARIRRYGCNSGCCVAEHCVAEYCEPNTANPSPGSGCCSAESAEPKSCHTRRCGQRFDTGSGNGCTASSGAESSAQQPPPANANGSRRARLRIIPHQPSRRIMLPGISRQTRTRQKTPRQSQRNLAPTARSGGEAFRPENSGAQADSGDARRSYAGSRALHLWPRGAPGLRSGIAAFETRGCGVQCQGDDCAGSGFTQVALHAARICPRRTAGLHLLCTNSPTISRCKMTCRNFGIR